MYGENRAQGLGVLGMVEKDNVVNLRQKNNETQPVDSYRGFG
jgi:hypothetical protein